MAMDDLMEHDEKKFFKFQSDWYAELEKFIKRGDVIQAKLKKSGAIAPTEVLMFLLFWETVNRKYKDNEIDFIRYMLIDILENDSRFRDKLMQDEDLGFNVAELFMKSKKKTTIH